MNAEKSSGRVPMSLTIAPRSMQIHDWTFDPQRSVLRRGSECVRLEPKAADLLRVLHEGAGAVLGKDALIRAVWGDVAISPEVLTTAIYQLRRALGDDRQAPRYIETIPRRGYRLLPNPVIMTQPVRHSRTLVLSVVVFAVTVAIGAFHHRRVDRIAARELHAVATATIARGEDLNAAVTMLRRAAELNARDGRIAGSLALALALVNEQGDKAEEARATAERALRLEPSNTHAHIARAMVALWTDWDWNLATSDLETAASSGDPLGTSWLAFVSSLRGHRITAMRLAKSVDGPPIAASTASSALLLAGFIDDAEDIAERALRTAPRNELLVKQLRKVRERRLEGSGAAPLNAQRDVRRPTDVARLHLAYGNRDAALTALEDALRQRDRHLLFLRVDTRWEPIRGHRRFQSVAAAVGL